MLAYIIRRLFYAIPILIGVNLLTFTLFFVVNSPDDMAVSQLGEKYVTPEAIEAWKKKQGYDKPLFVNAEAQGLATLMYTRVDAEERARKQIEWNQPVTWPLYAAAMVVAGLITPGIVAYRRRQKATARETGES